jgi:pimeloyl-ACP methyl ester carboxylesterase
MMKSGKPFGVKVLLAGAVLVGMPIVASEKPPLRDGETAGLGVASMPAKTLSSDDGKSHVRNRYRFEDPEVPVTVFYDASTPIENGSQCRSAVILIHGWGGHVRKLLPVFNAALAARADGVEPVPYVIAPMFPRRVTLEKNPGEADDGRAVWNDSWAKKANNEPGLAADDWRGGGDANGTNFSSYDYIDRILFRLGDKTIFPKLRRIVLAGFSAGGQFAGRYAAIGKGAVRKGIELVYIDMSPSTEFRFEKNDPWHYGLKGRPRYGASLTDEDIMKNLCSRRVWRGCGSKDTLGRPHTALDMTPPAVRQGKNRLERFRNFEKYLDAYPEWKRQTSFHVFEGIGHKEDLAYPTKEVLDFVFGAALPKELDAVDPFLFGDGQD